MIPNTDRPPVQTFSSDLNLVDPRPDIFSPAYEGAPHRLSSAASVANILRQPRHEVPRTALQGLCSTGGSRSIGITRCQRPRQGRISASCRCGDASGVLPESHASTSNFLRDARGHLEPNRAKFALRCGGRVFNLPKAWGGTFSMFTGRLGQGSLQLFPAPPGGTMSAHDKCMQPDDSSRYTLPAFGKSARRVCDTNVEFARRLHDAASTSGCRQQVQLLLVETLPP